MEKREPGAPAPSPEGTSGQGRVAGHKNRSNENTSRSVEWPPQEKRSLPCRWKKNYSADALHSFIFFFYLLSSCFFNREKLRDFFCFFFHRAKPLLGRIDCFSDNPGLFTKDRLSLFHKQLSFDLLARDGRKIKNKIDLFVYLLKRNPFTKRRIN